MTAGGQLCYTDAYARSVEARVVSVDLGGASPIVVLDQTVFYPGGGGQPSDRGLLLRAEDGRTWTVTGARKAIGKIAHELEPGVEPPAVGDRLRVDLEWARRLALMRSHTALHALCGVVWRDYGALVTGGNMEPGGGRMDFEFERMAGELVGEIESKVNDELTRGREVRVNVLPRAEAFAIRPHPDEDQPPATRDRGDPDDRDRRARPPGRRRDARRQYVRGRADQGDRLRVEGPDQQANPDRARRRFDLRER